MGIIKNFIRKTGWAQVYDLATEGGKARAFLLSSAMTQGVVGGLTTGIFYTGLLMAYGINIVNISILSIIPHIASLCTLLSPYILERIKRRRLILSVSRIVYYTINILGITLLPQMIHSNTGRIWGLIAITFISQSINYLFASGYNVWHMPYIPPEVRSGYYASMDMCKSISSTIFLVVASIVTDRLGGESQLQVIIILRYVAFAVALLDVYFMQKPREPVYETTGSRPKLLDIFRLPLSNKKFRLTCLIYGLYFCLATSSYSLMGAWMLDEIKTGFLYTNLLDVPYVLFVFFTTGMWSAFARKHGTFKGLAFGVLFYAPFYLLYGLVNTANFVWLIAFIRLSQQFFSLSIVMPANNLMYINTPEEDRTNYLSFYSIVTSTAAFVGTSLGTALVASMGTRTWSFFGNSVSSVPTLLMLQGVLMALLGVFILAVRKKVEPDTLR